MFYEKTFYIIFIPELTQSELHYKLAGFTEISVFFQMNLLFLLFPEFWTRPKHKMKENILTKVID